MASTSANTGTSSNQRGSSGPAPGSRKRQRNSSSASTTSRAPKRPKGPMPPKKDRKKTSDQYHLTREDVGEDKDVKKGFETHIRALAGLTKSSHVPHDPSDDLRTYFNGRWGPTSVLHELKARLRETPSNMDGVRIADELRRAVTIERSDIARNIGRMKDRPLRIMFCGVVAAGLKKWCPDILGSPDSMYNQVHEMVAIETFQVVAAAFGYVHMNVDLSKVQNDMLLKDLYQSFVFSYLKGLVLKEMKKPGAVAQGITDSNIYRRWQAISNHRVNFLVSERFPARAINIATSVECHSDDEGPNPNPANACHGIFYINEKEAWNPYITDLFRDFWEERMRQYDPTHAKIALPLPTHWDEDWRSLSQTDFMEKYGNEVRDLYDLPTDSDIEGDEEDEVEEMMDDD
ncbi:hypothetical protein DFH06DRAFT_1140346 [Mycena polygramma]|nr:hypothetical protein DFH06DRAFT_1140346 [Mycena polygramma]